jgi:glucose-1-phosphate thymidylyltransferase
MALVGVIPAAGYGTRLQPIAGSKEVLPVRGRQVIDYLVERMRAAGVDALRVVTRPEKADVARRARQLGAEVIRGQPANVSESILLGAEGLASGDCVLVGFPDTIWEPVDGFVRLLEALSGDVEIVLGLFRTPQLTRSDVVTVEGERVTGVYPKPAEPRSELVWGCLAARAGALPGLREHREPGDYLDVLARAGVVHAVDFGTMFVDIGTPASYAEAAG